MEERAIEEQQIAKARDKVRADLGRAAKATEQMRSGEDISEIAPHLLGR
jgi:type IV secretory pathway VirB6-like protein